MATSYLAKKEGSIRVFFKGPIRGTVSTVRALWGLHKGCILYRAHSPRSSLPAKSHSSASHIVLQSTWRFLVIKMSPNCKPSAIEARTLRTMPKPRNPKIPRTQTPHKPLKPLNPKIPLDPKLQKKYPYEPLRESPETSPGTLKAGGFRRGLSASDRKAWPGTPPFGLGRLGVERV